MTFTECQNKSALKEMRQNGNRKEYYESCIYRAVWHFAAASGQFSYINSTYYPGYMGICIGAGFGTRKKQRR